MQNISSLNPTCMDAIK